MTIEVKRSTKYGGVNVTDKYRPLEVTYVKGQRALYSKLITNRHALMTSTHVLPQPLYLRTNWDAAVAEEAGQLPPLVVISTNRSKWIADGIAAGEAQFDVSPYTGENDLKALTDYAIQGQAPPLYTPRRTGATRNIYIVVHIHEQAHYAQALRGTRIRVVGWKFDAPERSPIGQLVGFGASRFAAIEFCKHLRTRARNPWNYAWLLDDNVVGLTSFPGYTVFETAMTAAPTRICAGFRGGTKAEAHKDTVRWAQDEVNATPTRAIPPATLPTIDADGGLVQQASLWNIAELTRRKLNFAPTFVASGEDVSISAYLDLEGITYYYFNGVKVWKEVAGSDGTAGANLVNQARGACTRWFVDAETAEVEGTTAPPPVMVNLKDGESEKLSVFITNWLRTTPPTHLENAGTDLVQQKAVCHGVEQIVCEAAGKKHKLVDVKALAANLRINGDNDQAIVRLNWLG